MSRCERRFGDGAPCVRRDDDGTDWWWVGGQRTNSFAGGSQAGRRFENAGALVLADSIDNVRDEVWTPARYVSDNLADGIGASVLYPTQQMQHYAVRDSALVSATCRVYNDWLADFCQAEPTRLRGIAALNADDAEEAAAEVYRVAGLGLAGALLPVGLPHGHSYADPRFEPVWRAAEETGLPLSFHIGTYRANPSRDRAVVIAGTQTAVARPVQSAFANADSYVRTVLADVIFTGVLERHPGLRVVSAEHEIGWLAHFVERMDYTYTQRATRGHRFADAALPSDFVSRQVWVQFCEDPHWPLPSSMPWAARKRSVGSGLSATAKGRSPAPGRSPDVSSKAAVRPTERPSSPPTPPTSTASTAQPWSGERTAIRRARRYRHRRRSGLGQAYAALLAERGASVVVNDIDTDAAASAAASLAGALVCPADVAYGGWRRPRRRPRPRRLRPDRRHRGQRRDILAPTLSNTRS